MAAGLGAILKAAGTIVADTAKDAAASKAKSFITGKGKGKGGALVKAGGQKPTVDPSSFMGRQVGGDKGGVDIPASRQTINVTAEGSDSAVGPSGGGGDIKIVQDISIAVSAIAESMKSGLILKDKQEAKKRKAAEKDKRAAQEADIEKPDDPKKKGGGGIGKVKVPGVGILSGIFGFLTKFIFGVGIMKLIELADSPLVKGIFAAVKGAGKVIKFLDNFLGISRGAGALLNGLISFIDFGYKIVDGMERIVTNIFGEEGAEKFRTFMENLKTLINSFLIFKIIKGKIGEALAKNIKNAFKLIKGVARRALIGLKRFLGPGARKGIKGLFQAGIGLVSKGASKVGGFAAKIFGKAAGVISPAFKGAKPFLSKFFSKVPIVGPLVITIVSLLSGEPATQAIFKGLGAALGGALGTFIPIPILGTLIGETIGVFVGDLIYAGLFGGGMSEVGQKLKDTFKTFIEPVFNFFKDGIGRFFSNFPMIDIPAKFGIQTALGKLFPFMANSKGLVTSFPNLSLFIPGPGSIELIKHMGASFMPGIFGDKSESKKEKANIDDKQDNKNGANADAVAEETTYESGEGDAVIIPVPIAQTKTVSTGRRNKRGSGAKTRVLLVDDTELAMYGGK